MRYRELFGLGIRFFGIWLICRGAVYVAAFADTRLFPLSEKAKVGAAANLIYATIDFALAAFFLLWTRVIIAWSYDGDHGERRDEEARVASPQERE